VSEAVDFEDYLEAEVVDQAGNVIGSLDCYWTNHEGDAEFLGVKSPRARDNTVVVPSSLAEANERQSCVVLRVSGRKFQGAPTLECDDELDHATEQKVYSYFDISGEVSRHHLHIHKLDS
jgi:hypothetical protein